MLRMWDGQKTASNTCTLELGWQAFTHAESFHICKTLGGSVFRRTRRRLPGLHDLGSGLTEHHSHHILFSEAITV